MSKRLEKLQKARSLNDVLNIVNEIEQEFKTNSNNVDRLVSSLSAEELVIDRRAAGATKPTVRKGKFVAPPLAELKKHNAIVDSLYENLLELDAAAALVAQAFAGNKNHAAALKHIKLLRVEVENKVNDALEALALIAEKHVPSELTVFADRLVGFLIDTLDPKRYRTITKEMYVTRNSDGGIEFSHYLGIDSLKVSSGHVYDQYYLVLTGVVNKAGEMNVHLNAFPDFKLPGRYPVGLEVRDPKAALLHAKKLLAADDVISSSQRVPLPFEPERAKSLGLTTLRGVEDATVDKEELVITLAASVRTENAVMAVVQDVLARLSSVLNRTGSSKKNLFTYKTGTRAGKKVLRFQLSQTAAGAKSTALNLEKLEEVAELLSLSPAQKKALRFALNN